MVYSLLKNFTSYWEERLRPIIIFHFFMNKNISFFPPAREHGLIDWIHKKHFQRLNNCIIANFQHSYLYVIMTMSTIIKRSQKGPVFLGFKQLSLSWLERFLKKWFSFVGYLFVYLIHQTCNNMQIFIPTTLILIFGRTWIS